ncbi:ribosome silencing factor [Rhodobacteraceae bacterium RKSG542]|uniref:ribosome silencing factor n=1 Tax=Pseudovibrio flavus TaxID=2529854 RepID=UPI0012BCB99E|nr:ribosome silencing factor [Pseudovibrio flavus]MTI17764.1 ribosome silencing factor [Pseudovibrio flavus]
MTVNHEGPEKAALHKPEALEESSVLELILNNLEDSKAEEIVSLDLQGKSALADCMVVATGRSQRHVGAIADHLLRALKIAGYGNARVEGLPHCDWVLIDIGDAIIHVFRPEVRAFYNVEKMWSAENTSPHLHG